MAKAWKKWDLGGGGLQSANLALARHRKRPLIAYLLWLLFPLGGHAWYLAAPVRGAVFLGFGLLALASVIAGHAEIGLFIIAAEFLYAIRDLFWVDRRLVELDKQLRLALSLRPGSGAPPAFAGRYTDDGLDTYLAEKSSERAGHLPPGAASHHSSSGNNRVPSFAEQEALLREHARGKGKK
ncbi:MAG: TM2 domain-containing protein [Acidiferrobacteraceae bacterium]